MEIKYSFDDIVEQFDTYGIQIKLSEELKNKCVDLCETYDVNGEHLAVTWLNYAALNDYDEVNLDSLKCFENELIKQTKTHAKKSSTEDNLQCTPNNTLSVHDDVDAGELLAAYGAAVGIQQTEPESPLPSSPATLSTPTTSRVRRSLALSTLPAAPSLASPCGASQRFSQRTNAGVVVASFGGETENEVASNSTDVEVTLLPCGNTKALTAPYNYMFEKLRDIVDVLSDSTFYLGNEIKDAMQIEETVHLKSVCNEKSWFLGRVCCDSVGLLNSASVLLQGDRDTSSGACVRLSLDAISQYALFPGQVVAVNGVNPTGDCILANEIILGKVLPPPELPISLNEDLQVCVACGPFTTSENLSYEPLADLLEKLCADPPHVLLLVGPLLDASHPCLDDPALSDSYDSIVSRCLQNIESLKSTFTKVFVVMSSKDACAFPIYPTPPAFLSSATLNSESIRLLPDPSLLNIHGFTMAITTVDFPMHISREEINKNASSDRLARLSRHLLLQQSFYPLSPPPEGFSVNEEQMELNTRLPFTPHVMVTPSDFKGYVKEMDNCIFVNPERLTKGTVGGSYCRLLVKSTNSADLNMKFDISVRVMKI